MGDDWPSVGGVYVLLLELYEAQSLCIGSLGQVTLAAGCYAYVGSAHGPGGLRQRLARHLRKEKQIHWHIDYLIACATVSGIYWQATSERLECRWVQALQRLPGATVPCLGFGSSDCRNGCRSHLIRLPESVSESGLQQVLREPL